MKKVYVLLWMFLLLNRVIGQVNFFTESMGNPLVTTPVNSYTGWQNPPPVLFSSTGTASDVRSSSPSAGYPGATANGNVFMGTAGTNARDLIISGINTSAYTSVELSFGILSNTANNMVTVEYSTDGINYTALTVNNSIAANTWVLKTASGFLPSSSTLSIRFSKNAAVQYRIDDVRLTGFPAGTPDIVLSSSHPALPAAVAFQGERLHPLSRFSLAVTMAPATLTGLTVHTAGSYAATDLDSLQCWYSADSLLDPLSDILLSTKKTALGAGSHSFPSFLPQTIAGGSSGYFFITAAIPCTAVSGNYFLADPINPPDLIFSSGNLSGSAFAGGIQTIQADTPLNVTALNAVAGNLITTISWVNPAGCFDEIMIVAAAGGANTGMPSGDGSGYTANLVFGSGSALGNGFVLYKGSAGPQTATGLTNGMPYYFKLFSRRGSQWSIGTEINAVPVAISASTDHFRSAVASGNWDQLVSWESSANGISNWIPATLTPTATANTIRIITGDTIYLTNPVVMDQVIVEAGARLVLQTGFTLADDPGGTDLQVEGTLVNVAGTHTFNGTIVFGAGSIYQHQRNAGTVPPANWHTGSLTLFTGITSTAPSGLGQLFGNVTWNCPGQTASVNLAGALMQIAGNFTISHCSATPGRVLRMTGAATNPLLSIGGDFVINSSAARFEFGNGSATGAQLQIGGSFLMSAGTFNANVNGSLLVLFTGVNKDFNQSGDNFNGTQVDWLLQSGASLNLQSHLPVAAGRLLTVMGTLNAGQLQITGAGSIFIGGTLQSGHGNGISSTGTLAHTGTVTIGPSSIIHFHSALTQQLTGRSDYAGIRLSGGGNKTLTGPVSMSGTLALQDGRVFLGSHDFIITNPVAATAIATYHTGAYLVTNGTGALQRAVAGAGTYVFPVGNSNHLQELSIHFPNALASANTLSASFITGSGGANGLPLTETGHLINRTSAFGYWQLTPGTPFTDVYTGTFIARGFGDIIDYSRLHLLKRADAFSPWVLDGNHVPTTGFNYLATLQRTGMSGFSQFGAGGENNVSLPVRFNSFGGRRTRDHNLLYWTTGYEQGNRGFEVQRSENGRIFTRIGWVESHAPNGNSSISLSYQFKDMGHGNRLQYYRLRPMEADGREKYSPILLIHPQNPNGLCIEKIYPQPVKDQVTVVLTAGSRLKGQLVLADMAGRVLIQRMILAETGTNIFTFSLTDLPPGYWHLRLTGEDGSHCQAGILKQ